MKMLINGKHVDSRDGKVIEIRNPATGILVDTVPAATAEDVDEAIRASKNGLAKWKAIPLMEKERIINKFCNSFDAHKREIVELHVMESGFGMRNCLLQYQGVPGLFKGYIESAKRLNGSVLVPGTEAGHDGKTKEDLQLVLTEPVGTVVTILPFNAPLMLFAYKVASALSVGNSVIVKPPSTNPLGVIKLAEMLWEAGVPGDALQVVTGNGATVGNLLANDPRVNAVTLTGSTEVGIQIATMTAKRLAPCALELGGNDPFIVMGDYDPRAAAMEGARWRMNSSGQVCISPKRFIVHNSIKEEFTKVALEYVKTLELGIGVDPKEEIDKYIDCDFSVIPNAKMSCLITESAAKKVEEQVNKTVAAGAKVLIGGHRHGAFYEPTILTGVTKDMDVAKDMEIFGPVMPIIGFDTAEEAIEIANSSCYGLSGCVMTKDWKLGMNMARQIQSGGVVVNGNGMYRNIMQPFGGMKNSGMGREGLFTLGELVEKKVIVLKGFLSDSIAE